MGKSASARRSPPPESPPPAAPPPAPPQVDDPAADAIIAEAQTDHIKPPKTIIQRIAPDTGERKFVGEVVTDLVTLEWLGRRFGGGKYSLTHRKAKPTGGYEYAAHETVHIDESIKPDPPATSTTGEDLGSRAPGVAPVSSGNVIQQAMEAGVLSLIQQMQNQNQLTVAMIERLTKGEDRRGPSMLEAITPFIPVIVEFVKSRKDPTDLAVQLATLMSKRDAGAAGPEQLVTMLEKGVSLATKLGDRAGGSSDSIMPVVSEGVKVLGDVVGAVLAERAAARGEPARPLQLVPSTTETPVPRSSPPTPPALPDRPWLQFARPLIPSLVSAARFMPPDAAAATIAAQLSPAAFDDLVADIQDDTAPGFVGRLAQQFPAVAQLNPQWFQTMLTLLLEADDGADVGEDDDSSPRPA